MLKNNWLVLVCLVMLSFVLAACEGISDVPSSGSSEEDAPESIIGFKLVETVVEFDGKPTTISEGDVTYQFVNENTILGAGLHTLETTS